MGKKAIVISILSILGISAISGTIAYFVLKNKDSNLNNNESDEIKTIAENFKTQINNTNIKLKEINEDEIIKQIKSKINLDEKYDFQIDAINVLDNKTIILNIKLFLKSNSNISHTIENIQLNFEIIPSNTDPNLNLIKQIAEDFKNQLNTITIELDNLNVNNIKQKIKEKINLNQDYDFDILSSSQIQNSQIILDIKLFLISDSNINLILKDVHIKIKYSILTQLNEYSNQIKDYLNTSRIELEDYQWINLTNESLKSILNDYLTVQTPSDYDFEIISFIKQNTNNSLGNLEIKFKLFYKPDINLFVETNLNVECTINKNVINNPDQINIDKVLEYATLIPKTNPDYHTLTAKQFYKISNPFEIKKYFQINENELNTIFGSNNLNDYTFTFTLSNSGFNFLKPTTVAFEIKVQKTGIGTKSKIIEFNDFKEDNSIIGQIDKLALNQLYTPANAVSYKEKLERFELTDIKPTSENNYNDVLKRTTWDKVKWEFMYQVRFYIYQMFSDNFSEINYYIINEINEKSFSAVCEGIIKESRNNVLYGPLVSFGTSGCNTRSNVKTGDKIRFQINFNVNQTGFQPSLLNRSSGTNLDWGEFSNPWWWDFSDNCNNLRNINNPLYVADNLPRISWAGKIKNWSVSINNSTTLSFSPNQWSSYSFIDKVTIPKNNK